MESLREVHVLVVSTFFPHDCLQVRGSFIRDQVQQISNLVGKVTVLAPRPLIPQPLLWVLKHLTPVYTPPRRWSPQPPQYSVTYPRYIRLPTSVGALFLEHSWRRLVEREVDSSKADWPVGLIHAHHGSVSARAGVGVARSHGLPSVVTYHGSDVNTTLAQHRSGWRFCAYSAENADVNICVSRALARTLSTLVPDASEIRTIYLGVDTAVFRPAARLERRPRVLFVGNLEAAKGVFELIESWKAVRIVCPDAKLTLVGADHSRGRVLNAIGRSGLDDSIDVAGEVPRSRMPVLYQNSRVFCLPSHREGAPVSLMEAMASGLPAVATAVGGIPELMKSEFSGILVGIHDTENLANSIVRLIRDYQLCVEMGRAARSFSVQNLDSTRNADAVVSVYEGLKCRRLATS